MIAISFLHVHGILGMLYIVCQILAHVPLTASTVRAWFLIVMIVRKIPCILKAQTFELIGTCTL